MYTLKMLDKLYLVITGGSVLAGAGVWLITGLLRNSRKTNYPEGTVILHHISRGLYAPSLSPFAIKVETYLRMANIPYQVECGLKFGPKKKVPFIHYSGKVVADSEFIIEFLNKEFAVDLNKNLTSEQTAQARAFQKMVDENTYWGTMLTRWYFLSTASATMFTNLNWFILWRIKHQIHNLAYGHGMGRHEEQEVNHILEGDLKALSKFLGDKKFMFGDEATQVDCAIFGQLSQLKWCTPDCHGKTLLIGECKNLDSYCERMKTTFWPDWDGCLLQKSTKDK